MYTNYKEFQIYPFDTNNIPTIFTVPHFTLCRFRFMKKKEIFNIDLSSYHLSEIHNSNESVTEQER